MYNAISFDPKFSFFPFQGQRSASKPLAKKLSSSCYADFKKDALSFMRTIANEPINTIKYNSWLNANHTKLYKESIKRLIY